MKQIIFAQTLFKIQLKKPKNSLNMAHFFWTLS